MANSIIATSEEQAIIGQVIQQAQKLAPYTKVNFICRVRQNDKSGLLLGMHLDHPGAIGEIQSFDLYDLLQAQSKQSNIPLGITCGDAPKNFPQLDLNFLPPDTIYLPPARAPLSKRAGFLRYFPIRLPRLTDGEQSELSPALVAAFLLFVGFALGSWSRDLSYHLSHPVQHVQPTAQK